MNAFFRYLAVMACFLFVLPAALKGSPLEDAVRRDRRQGLITRSEELGLRARALVARHTLPEPYASVPPGPPLKSLTPFTAELDRNISLFSAADLQAVSALFARPVLAYRLETDHFVIHYDLTGTNAVDTAFADSTARIMEYCYDRIVTDRGYPAPPEDDRFDPKYDVYLVDVPTTYDQTFLGVTRRDTYRQETVSYIEMDNGFQDSIYGVNGVEALKVVSAHELFHAVQFACSDFPAAQSGDDYVWWMEWSSTWIEDEIYDDVDHYVYYLYPRYANPHLSLLTYNGWYEYGNAPFVKMLERLYGPGVMKDVWDALAANTALLPYEAVRSVLELRGTDWATEFHRYTLWNFFTRSYADSVNYFEECGLYPYTTINTDFNYHYADVTPVFDGPDSLPLLPEYLGANYVGITRCAAVGSLHFEFTDRGGGEWRLHVMTADRDLNVTVDTACAAGSGTWTYDWKNADAATDFYVAVSRVGEAGTGEYAYSYTAYATGDVPVSGTEMPLRTVPAAYPLPAGAFLTLSLPWSGSGYRDPEVFSAAGRRVNPGIIRTADGIMRIDVTGLAPGHYVLRTGGSAPVPFAVVR